MNILKKAKTTDFPSLAVCRKCVQCMQICFRTSKPNTLFLTTFSLPLHLSSSLSPSRFLNFSFCLAYVRFRCILHQTFHQIPEIQNSLTNKNERIDGRNHHLEIKRKTNRKCAQNGGRERGEREKAKLLKCFQLSRYVRWLQEPYSKIAQIPRSH